ncbi:MAG: ABC transporter permease [Acetatifactor sp.]|nr:ABC transporter permease [Acetatifactor sp.]
MRLRSLFLLDMRFQAKYGFYFLYAALTVVYVIVLFALPQNWREKAAAILIFSDPAAMGLFFMGAIVLLEKSQHTPCAFAVSPVLAVEYIIAKVASLSAVSLVVATVLALAASVDNLHIVLLGTVISSVIFTLLGIIVATKIVSLNQFILWTVPIEIVCFVPAMLHLFKITPEWFQYYPINACMDMISGHFPSTIGLFSVIAMTATLFALARFCVLKMWDSIGGVKL